MQNTGTSTKASIVRGTTPAVTTNAATSMKPKSSPSRSSIGCCFIDDSILFITLRTTLLPRDEAVVSRVYPTSPRYTPQIFVPLIESALPHPVNSR